MYTLNIQVSDDAYAALAAVAESDGRSIEAVAADQLEADFADELPAGFWTPELLASIDAAAAEADLGGGKTLDEVRQEMAERSRAWREKHPA